MKSLSLYEITIPVIILYLSNLLKILAKGERYAAKKKWGSEEIVSAKLAPDMYNFIQQIQYSYFTALEAATSLSGRAMPAFLYDEKTAKDLKKNLTNAIAFLKKIKEKEFEGAGGKKIKTFLDDSKLYAADKYVKELAIPNFFFHVTTAYDILRHLGVSIGKDDYLGLS